MKLVRRIVIGVVALGIVLYAGALAVLYFGQRTFQYFPSGPVLALADTTLTGAAAVAIPTADNAVVNGWYEAPKPGHPLIVYYHGNAENFTKEHERYEAMAAGGFGFLAFDYRGFPASPGAITQDHVLADALAAFDWAKAKGFPTVIWGRSLGSGPATYTASQRPADALLLETPFDSALAVARDRYPIFPVGLLMQDQYPVDQWIGKVTAPVFVAHGTADNTIAEYHGQRVYDLAPNKGGIWIVRGADHDDLWADGVWEKAQAFFAGVEAGKQ